jgi:glycosyltransferase involved in cell wall biosynthesis
MRRGDPSRRRIGVYLDAVYHRDADGALSANVPFVTFACEVGRRFERCTLVGRLGTGGQPLAFAVPAGIDLAGLPRYPSLRHVGAVLRATSGTARVMWRVAGEVDLVWAFGPHPFALLFVATALLRRKKVRLGVRQDTMAYFRARLPGRRWRPVVLPLEALDVMSAAVSRRVPTVAFGRHLIPGRRSAPALDLELALTRSADVVSRVPDRDYSGRVELLTVSRIEPEKNPLLLLEAMASLERRQPGRFRLTWIGSGALEGAVRERIVQLGIGHAIDLRGYVPFGEELLDVYRGSHVFVHVSLTEGVPLVLFEALSSGCPVVATDVGGVRRALRDGDVGLLVPPDDREALVDAILAAVDDDGLRERTARRGLELARGLAFDVQADRVARFLVEPASSDGASGAASCEPPELPA